MIVVDTNIIAYFYLDGKYTKEAEKLFSYDPQWIVPMLWRSEFRNILAHFSSSDVLELVSISDCSAHDCEFVCLAKEIQVPLDYGR